MSDQPVLCPACAAPMRMLGSAFNVFKCDRCGFGSCLGSEVAAIDKRVKERVDRELAEVREHAKTLQHVHRGMYEEFAARADAQPGAGANCPACGLAFTRTPKSRWLDCAACGDRISVEWAGKYAAELGRLRQLVFEAGQLRAASEAVDATTQALARVGAAP